VKLWLGVTSLREPPGLPAGDSSEPANKFALISGFHFILELSVFHNLEESWRFRSTCDERP
jgi:hypothetical protein